jgi:hypothetical protein
MDAHGFAWSQCSGREQQASANFSAVRNLLLAADCEFLTSFGAVTITSFGSSPDVLIQ